MGNIEFIKTTRAKYNTLTKDPNVLYLLTDTGEMVIQNKIFKQANSIRKRDEYYVSIDGNDNNDGLSPSTALQTIQTAVNKSNYSTIWIYPNTTLVGFICTDSDIKLLAIGNNTNTTIISPIDIKNSIFYIKNTKLYGINNIRVDDGSVAKIESCIVDGINNKSAAISASNNSFIEVKNTKIINSETALDAITNSNIYISNYGITEKGFNNKSANAYDNSNIYTLYENDLELLSSSYKYYSKNNSTIYPRNPIINTNSLVNKVTIDPSFSVYREGMNIFINGKITVLVSDTSRIMSIDFKCNVKAREFTAITKDQKTSVVFYVDNGSISIRSVYNASTLPWIFNLDVCVLALD